MEAGRPPREVMQVRGGQMLRLVAPVARYTRFVMLGKHFLFWLAIASIGLVVWIASDNTGVNSGRMVFTPGQVQNLPQLNEMLKPHYQGVDAKNQPYTVTAEKAIQLDANNITMHSVRADLTQTSGQWIALDAGNGDMNTVTKQMKLKDHVTLFYEGGYEFRTDHTDVDLQTGSAQGDSPIEGQGPAGTIKANSFSLLDRGGFISFNGSVITTLYPHPND